MHKKKFKKISPVQREIPMRQATLCWSYKRPNGIYYTQNIIKNVCIYTIQSDNIEKNTSVQIKLTSQIQQIYSTIQKKTKQNRILIRLRVKFM